MQDQASKLDTRSQAWKQLEIKVMSALSNELIKAGISPDQLQNKYGINLRQDPAAKAPSPFERLRSDVKAAMPGIAPW